MREAILLPWPEGDYVHSALNASLLEHAAWWARQCGHQLFNASPFDAPTLIKTLQERSFAYAIGGVAKHFSNHIGPMLNPAKACKWEILEAPPVSLPAAAQLRFGLVKSWSARGLAPLTDLYFGQCLPEMEKAMTQHLRRERWL